MFLEEKAWVSDDYRFATITNGLDGTAPDYVSYWGTMLELTLGTVDLDIPVTEIELNPPQIIF